VPQSQFASSVSNKIDAVAVVKPSKVSNDVPDVPAEPLVPLEPDIPLEPDVPFEPLTPDEPEVPLEPASPDVPLEPALPCSAVKETATYFKNCTVIALAAV